MSNTGNQLPFNKSPTSVTSATKTAASLNRYDSDSCFQDISLCSSVPICRICHCSGEEEQLIHPCHCCGSVRYAHQSCLRTWIVGSGISSCELCNYKFITKRKCINDVRKLHFPRPSVKGWLHLFLFLTFFSILLTSLSWIMWSQISSSNEAKAERISKEINYAYALNGGFIVMAFIGLYIDSFTQCRRYYRRWAILNQYLIILPCDMKEDTKNESLESRSALNNSQISTEPHGNPIMSISSHHNSGLGLHQIANFDMVLANPIHLHSYYLNEENVEVNEHWSVMSSPLQLPSEGHDKRRFSLRQSHSAPISLQYSQTIRESYV